MEVPWTEYCPKIVHAQDKLEEVFQTDSLSKEYDQVSRHADRDWTEDALRHRDEHRTNQFVVKRLAIWA
jgi:hypothetical protein